jgi:hypothetical protein
MDISSWVFLCLEHKERKSPLINDQRAFSFVDYIFHRVLVDN